MRRNLDGSYKGAGGSAPSLGERSLSHTDVLLLTKKLHPGTPIMIGKCIQHPQATKHPSLGIVQSRVFNEMPITLEET